MSATTAPMSRAATGTVVSLADYRSALHAAAFLRGTLHEPAWLRGVTVEVTEDGALRIVVLLAWQTPLLSRCLPTAVCRVPVLQRVVR